jgi:hypothetical protein
MTDIFKKNQITNELVTFRVIWGLISIISWSFYPILLYQQTGSISVILVESLIFFINVWVGYVISSFTVDRIGYLSSYRLAYFFNAVTFGLLILLFNEIATLYFIIGIVRGISAGFFWSDINLNLLKEFSDTDRGSTINLYRGIDIMLRIVLPVLTGSLLFYTGEYRLLFLICLVISLIAIILPFDYNKKGRSKITTGEITKILRNKRFPGFALIRMAHAGSKGLDTILMLIIPFLILESEFEVGALYSVIAFIAAILSFIQRKQSDSSRIKLGYIGVLVHNLFTVLFSFFWNSFFLGIRSIATVFGSATFDPTGTNLDLELREEILADDIEASSPEMNIIVETIYLIGRLFFYGSAIIALQLITNIEQTEDILRIILPLVSVTFTLVYFIYVRRFNRIIN